jgi:hypothetical protein
MASKTDICNWLEDFAACVRAADYAQGRRLFSPEVCSFGTIAEMARGLDELVETQWRQVWGATRDFVIDLDTAVIQCNGSDGHSYALVTWRSVNADPGHQAPLRVGRATIIFEPEPESPHGVRACHTHFSKKPPGGL